MEVNINKKIKSNELKLTTEQIKTLIEKLTSLINTEKSHIHFKENGKINTIRKIN